ATLHHLHGFPYIPGSSVKGLLHHFAEMEWMAETMAKLPEPTSLGEEPPEILKEAIEAASLVWTLFGSLVVERAKLKNGSLLGPKGPRERLTPWKERIKEEKLHEQEPWQGVYADLVRLLDTNRGAALTCFDAVPTKAAIQAGMLECDILNPHYPEYYRKEGAGISPSDTENPTPIYFLAVKPGVTFEFRFKLRDDDIHNGTPKNWSREALLEQVEAWLARALSEWGIGGKTSAGYGYFDPPHPVGQKGTPPGARKAKGTDPAGRMERKPPATPAEEARAILPPGLAPSELAQRIDRAPEYPEAVQREIARLFRVHYSQEVKKWRKKKEKPNVAKRLAWVERFSEGGEHDA
ncbi:MAG: type III-B CRISPR module RAMP protein Cmr6, partial [Deltaproteobacteria bacterium]